MTRVLSATLLDDCLDSTVVKEFVVEPPVSEPVMRAMAEGAELQYFPQFPRPYFRIERPRGYVVQGIVGTDRFRVTFSPSAEGDVEGRLRALIERVGAATEGGDG